MELTLLPLTALLLLLSGVTAPHYAASGGGLSTVAFVHLWFRVEALDGPVRPSGRRHGSRASGDGSYGLPVARAVARSAAMRTRLALRRFADRRLQTRFGVTSAAYRSTAPPVAA